MVSKHLQEHASHPTCYCWGSDPHGGDSVSCSKPETVRRSAGTTWVTCSACGAATSANAKRCRVCRRTRGRVSSAESTQWRQASGKPVHKELDSFTEDEKAVLRAAKAFGLDDLQALMFLSWTPCIDVPETTGSQEEPFPTLTSPRATQTTTECSMVNWDSATFDLGEDDLETPRVSSPHVSEVRLHSTLPPQTVLRADAPGYTAPFFGTSSLFRPAVVIQRWWRLRRTLPRKDNSTLGPDAPAEPPVPESFCGPQQCYPVLDLRPAVAETNSGHAQEVPSCGEIAAMPESFSGSKNCYPVLHPPAPAPLYAPKQCVDSSLSVEPESDGWGSCDSREWTRAASAEWQDLELIRINEKEDCEEDCCICQELFYCWGDKVPFSICTAALCCPECLRNKVVFIEQCWRAFCCARVAEVTWKDIAEPCSRATSTSKECASGPNKSLEVVEARPAKAIEASSERWANISITEEAAFEAWRNPKGAPGAVLRAPSSLQRHATSQVPKDRRSLRSQLILKRLHSEEEVLEDEPWGVCHHNAAELQSCELTTTLQSCDQSRDAAL